MNRFSLKWHDNLAKWQGFGRALTGEKKYFHLPAAVFIIGRCLSESRWPHASEQFQICASPEKCCVVGLLTCCINNDL